MVIKNYWRSIFFLKRVDNMHHIPDCIMMHHCDNSDMQFGVNY